MRQELSKRQHAAPQIEPGAICTVSVEDVAFGGDGVARIEGLAVFIPFALEGETVSIEITEVKNRYARARLRSVLQPSPARTAPVCDIYGVCGGCQYQHIDYKRQLVIKQQQVEALLARIGNWPDAPVRPIIPSAPWHYRNRITLQGPGAPSYVGVAHDERIPVANCPIAHQALNEALQTWRGAHQEGLRAAERLVLRLNNDGQAVVVSQGATRLSPQSVLGVSFEVPAQSFFQVNAGVADRLVREVLDAIRASGARVLVDGYAGAGVFGVLAAPELDAVWCIERDAAAVRAGRRNARQAGATRLRYVTGRVEDHLASVLQRLKASYTAVLLDPPRAGCPPAVWNALLRLRPRTVLYVSCAPDRLARDVRRLRDHGYRGVYIQPFDMFPQTAHIEVLTVMTG